MGKGILVFLVIACSANCQSDAPEELFRKAVRLQAAGKMEEAVVQYRAYLRFVPGRVEAISNLGAALARLGRMEAAIQQYKLALTKQPKNPEIRMNLALAYYKTTDLPAAVNELLILHRAYPDQVRVNTLLADCYLKQGEYKKVIELLAPIETKHPDDRAIAYLLGIALLRERRDAEGGRILDRLFREGDTAESHLLLGTAKLSVNDFMGAKDEFARAVALNPHLPGVYSMYGDALREVGASDEAQQAYANALKEDATDFTANLFIGARLRQDQNYEEALKYLRRAARVRPDSPAVRYQIAAAKFGQGKTEEAGRELEALVQKWPTFVEAHVTLAAAYFRLGRREEAGREQQTVRKLNAEIQARKPGATAAAPDPAARP